MEARAAASEWPLYRRSGGRGCGGNGAPAVTHGRGRIYLATVRRQASCAGTPHRWPRSARPNALRTYLRRFASRLLLFVLFGAVVFAFVRGCAGGAEAEILIEGVQPQQLEYTSFELSRPARVAISATGSFEDPSAAAGGADTALAAYGWLVRRAEGTVAWRLSARNAVRSRGSLAEATDTLALAAGVYDLYFASYGDPEVRAAAPRPRSIGGRLRRVLSNDGRAWVGDAGRWRIGVAGASLTDADALVARDDLPEDMVPGAPSILWDGTRAAPTERKSWMFEVREQGANVRLRAVAEAQGGNVTARAALERIGGGAPDTLWSIRRAATTWAGGARRNRAADTTLSLARGLYRISFVDNGSHAWGEWAANPPFVPPAYGLDMVGADGAAAEAVTALNPWSSLPRLASFSCIGPGADRRLTFTLRDSLDVMVYAVGEVTGSTVHDGARLLRRGAAGDPVPVWEMIAEDTRPAGGGRKNRLAEAMLSLTPGTYVLAYYSDDSHDCSDWNDDPPDNPARWGATLFVLDPDFDLRRVAVEQESAAGALGEAAEIAAATDTTGGGRNRARTLARLDRLGNNRTASAPLMMPLPGAVRIYAIGEIVPSGRFDYGWITSEDGRVVWEMTRANTSPAGGSAKNRLFDGTIRLPAGSYTVHFQTDARHAFGSFDQPPPDDPEGWGIRVEFPQ